MPVTTIRAEAIDDHHRSFLGPVHRFELENGLTVLIRPSSHSKTLSVHLAVRTGSSDEGIQVGSGLCHFVEHMFFKGTSRRALGQLEKDVRDIAGYINAYTSYDVTVYYLNTLSMHLDRALDILSDAAFNGSFDPVEVGKEREVILAEMRMNEDRLDRKAVSLLWELAYRTHPYRHPIIGYPELFKKITRDDLYQFYKRIYVPNNMVLSVAGDVNPDEAEKAIRRTFAAEPRSLDPAQAKPEEPIQTLARHTRIYRAAEHARVVMGFPTVPLSHHDTAALDVLAGILGDGRSSTLNQNIKEKDESILRISAFHSSMDDSGLFAIEALVLESSVEELKTALLREIESIQAVSPSAESLQKIKNRVLAEFYHRFEENSSVAHEILAGEVHAGDCRYSEHYAADIQAVTLEDLTACARKYLDVSKLNTAEVFPDTARTPRIEQNRPAKKPSDIRRITLKNGLKVILAPDPALPTIDIQYLSLAGLLLEPKGKSGVGELTSELLLKGTTQLNQEEIANRVESWGGDLEAFQGHNTTGLTVSLLSAYPSDALKLLKQVLTDSLFDKDEFIKAKFRQLEAIRSKTENVFHYSQQELAKRIFLSHPYRNDPMGEEAEVKALTREDVKSFHRLFLNPSRSILSMAGDFDPDKMLVLIDELFGNLTASSKDVFPAHPQEGVLKSSTLNLSLPREQAVAALGFSAPSIRNDDHYAFEMLNAVLSGSAGRLYQNIREKKGMSYVVNSQFFTGWDPGYFSLLASVDKGRSAETLKLLENEMKELLRTGPDSEEWEGARKTLLGQYEHVMESRESRLTQMSLYELYGLGYETWLEYPERLSRVQPDNFLTVIKKYIALDRSVGLTLEPSK